MRRRTALAVHALYWALYLVLLGLVFATLRLQQGRPPALPSFFGSRLGLLAIAPNVLAYGLSWRFVFRLLAQRQVARALTAAALVGVASAAAGLLLLGLTLGASPIEAPGELAAFTLALGLLATVHAVIALVLRGFVAWSTEAQRSQELELALLRARLDPHFLFNTLNNIDVLIARDPTAASTYLNALSELLRYVLYDARAARVSLAEELASIDRYLTLERLRTSNPRYVSQHVSGDVRGLAVAPMLFIPFIENAFKHTRTARTDEAITLGIAVEGRRLTFECRNARSGGRAPESAGGLGQALVQRRLDLLYPGRHSLRVTQGDETWSVHLTLELDAPSLPDH